MAEETELVDICKSHITNEFFLVKTLLEPVQTERGDSFETKVWRCNEDGEPIEEDPMDFDYTYYPNGVRRMHKKMCVYYNR